MDRQLAKAALKLTSANMSSASRIQLQSMVTKLAPVDMFSVPFAAMTTKKAIEVAVDLVCESWKKNPAIYEKYLESLRSEKIVWSLDLERRLEKEDLSGAEILALDEERISNEVVVGQPFRKRDLRDEHSNAYASSVKGPQGFEPCAGFAECTLFTRVPSSKIILGYKKDHLVVGSFEKVYAVVETSIRDADYLDSEIVPCGAIVITVGVRNALSGGLAKQESLTFRLDEDLALVPHSLSDEEAKEAELDSEKRLAGEKEFDFSENSCPLTAVSSMILTTIVIGDKIIHKTRGTVKHLSGAPNDFWIVFATGRCEHVVDSKSTESRLDDKFFI